MKKNDLIKMLQEIEGNPEVVLWNGMVGDWMPVGKLSESYLTKITKQYWLQTVCNEEKIKKKDWDYEIPQAELSLLEKQYRKFQWESSEFVTSEDIASNRYKMKTVIYIDAKTRGVKTFDRLGGIEY